MTTMKNSNVEWIGEIPSDWEVLRVKDGFTQKKAKAHQENPVVLTLARSGVKIRDMSNAEGQFASSYYDYNPVIVDDMLINPMDLISGDNCSLSKVEGVISPAYVNLRYKEGFYPAYYQYYFKYQYWCMAFFAHGKGVSFENRWTLNNETLMKFPLIVPPFEVQKSIANLLDQKCTEIDSLSTDIQSQIDILEEYKKSVITAAVTKGLNPDVKMKDSGIEWIGMIPAHWKCHKIKYVIDALNSGTALSNNKLKDEGLYPVYGGGELIGYYDNFNIKDTIIVGRVGARCGCITKISGKAWATDNALVIKTKENQEWLYYLLIATDLNRLNASNAQPLITGTKVLNVQIAVPSNKEKLDIANYLDNKCAEIDKVIVDKKAQLATLAEYKKSLIYEYVTGKKDIPNG